MSDGGPWWRQYDSGFADSSMIQNLDNNGPDVTFYTRLECSFSFFYTRLEFSFSFFYTRLECSFSFLFKKYCTRMIWNLQLDFLSSWEGNTTLETGGEDLKIHSERV